LADAVTVLNAREISSTVCASVVNAPQRAIARPKSPRFIIALWSLLSLANHVVAKTKPLITKFPGKTHATWFQIARSLSREIVPKYWTNQPLKSNLK
jgi:hypothetical protein